MLYCSQIKGKTSHQQKGYNYLYHGGLGPNPQRLQGMPVVFCTQESALLIPAW